MEIMYAVVYADVVVQEDIPALPKAMCVRIRSATEVKLHTHPDLYGKPL